MPSPKLGLRTLRERARLTQAEIAEEMCRHGVPLTQTELSHLENGLHEASAEILNEIRSAIERILMKRLTAVRQLLVRPERTESSA
jgi:transcriptional regulator with XRE-family HTH domain